MPLLLLKPTIACNMNCQYCYQTKWRKEAHPKVEYDLSAILAAIDKASDTQLIVLHGGEPLMLPKRDVESILSAVYTKAENHFETLRAEYEGSKEEFEKWVTEHLEVLPRTSIQTNGLMIDSEYIQMFKKYKTHVGLSLDGTGKLNRYRADEQTTSKIYSALLEMHSMEMYPSVIAVISKANAENDELLDKFERFIATLSELKITGRIHPCFPDHECGLGEGRLIEVYKRLAWFIMSHGWKWAPFSDMWNSLRGDGHVVCVFRECDIFHTMSCEVVLDDGSISNCMRVSSKGLYLRHPEEHKTRGEILQQVEQADGGCKGCKFGRYCTGGCPMQTIDDDWRNRTILCSMYKEIFQLLSNIQSFGLVKPENKKKAPTEEQSSRTEHSDGVEHLDGNVRHLDSGRV